MKARQLFERGGPAPAPVAPPKPGVKPGVPAPGPAPAKPGKHPNPFIRPPNPGIKPGPLVKPKACREGYEVRPPGGEREALDFGRFSHRSRQRTPEQTAASEEWKKKHDANTARKAGRAKKLFGR